MDPISIKDLPDGTKVLLELIDLGIKEGECSDACKLVALHCAYGSSQIQGIDFDKYYSPVAHADSFRINIAIADMNRLHASILHVSNSF